MEELPKDVLIEMGLELSPPDLINFCLVNKKTNICDNNDFWRLKIKRDYPIVFDYYQKTNRHLVNPKKTYIRKFTEVFRAIETFIDKNFENLSNIEKKKMSIRFNNLYEKILQTYQLSVVNPENIEYMILEHFPKNKNIDYKEIRKLMYSLLNKDKMYK